MQAVCTKIVPLWLTIYTLSAIFHYVDMDGARSYSTRQETCQQTLSEPPGSPTEWGRACLVEFGHNCVFPLPSVAQKL